MIPQVVASERGLAQTILSNWYGVEGLHNFYWTKQNRMGSRAKEGDSPVSVRISKKVVSWVARNQRNFVWICRYHPVRLNTPERPIANKYREGKVKRTARSRVKRTWNHALTSGRSNVRKYRVTACLLHNEPTSYSSLARLRYKVPQPQGNRVWIGRYSQWR